MRAWLEKVFSNVEPYLEPGSPIYIFNAHKQFSSHASHIDEARFQDRMRHHLGKANLLPSPTEITTTDGVFTVRMEKGRKGGHFWYGPNNETTLWEVKRDVTKRFIHPTQKPVELLPERFGTAQSGMILSSIYF